MMIDPCFFESPDDSLDHPTPHPPADAPTADAPTVDGPTGALADEADHAPDHDTHPVEDGTHNENQAPDDSGHLGQVVVHAAGGDASAVVVEDPRLDGDGSLSVMGVKHQLGHSGVGDYLDVWLPNGDHLTAKIEQISATHDAYRAVIGPDDAAALRENLPVALPGAADHGPYLGEPVEFEQPVGGPCTLLRLGYVAGEVNSGELVALGGTGAGPGASGSPVFNADGRLVGQVVAYDPVQNVNLMAPATQLLGDLDDFAAGRNLEHQASPVRYGN